MPDQFEKKHLSNIARRQREVKKLYEDAIQIVSVAFSQINFNGEVFKISDYPLLSNRIQSIIKGFKAEIYTTVVNGITDSWELSFDKNNLLVDKRLAGKKPSVTGKKVLYDPNLDALKQFIKRKEQGLNLSDRVWNSLDTYKTEMETALGVGISEGRSAVEMASDLKKYLNDPDKLFRKVRADDGTLKLSRAAKNFHPGQGVYRSSFQNALRLTGSETNMAYRSADYERWQTLPFVIGIEVHLSNNHPEYDICDSLKGVYPKKFLFRGWHPRCICFQTPVMISDDDYDRFEDAILDGEDPEEIKQISNTPVGFRNYVEQNRERIEGWKSKPYWFNDNKEFLPGNSSLQRKPEKKKPAKKKTTELTKSVKPAGKQIQQQFSNIEKRIKSAVDHALASIDNVHGDGDLKDIPFDAIRSTRSNAQFASAGGQPVRINVSTIGPTPSLSTVHEMGHYLDLYTIGNKGSFASNQPGSPIEAIIKEAYKTDAIKSIQETLRKRSLTIGGKTHPLSSDGVRYLKYLLQPVEIWARSYAQFIATRAGSELLSKQLDSTIVEFENKFFTQWKKDDFKGIEKAIEQMMIDLGWMTNQ